MGSGFCRVFRSKFITNWGSNLVPVRVEKLGSGFRKSGPGRVFRNQLHHYFLPKTLSVLLLCKLQMCLEKWLVHSLSRNWHLMAESQGDSSRQISSANLLNFILASFFMEVIYYCCCPTYKFKITILHVLYILHL